MQYQIVIKHPYDSDKVVGLMGPFNNAKEANDKIDNMVANGAHPDAFGDIIKVFDQATLEFWAAGATDY